MEKSGRLHASDDLLLKKDFRVADGYESESVQKRVGVLKRKSFSPAGIEGRFLGLSAFSLVTMLIELSPLQNV